MKLPVDVIDEIILFCASVWMGVRLRLMYLLIQGLEIFFDRKWVAVCLFDILFGAVAGPLIFVFLLYNNDGIVRGTVFVFIALGTFSMDFIIKKLGELLKKLYKKVRMKLD